LSEHQENADGTVTNLTALADGSSVSTWANPNGNYGFSVYNGATGEERDFSYYGLDDWSAFDEIQFGDGQIVTAYASSDTGGYVQLFDGDGTDNRLIFSDTNFGLDPLRGIDVTLDPSASNGPGITAISVSAGALQPYSSETATALSGGADPLAALNDFVNSTPLYGHPTLIYASQDPSKSSVVTDTSDLIFFTEGIDGSFHGTQGVLSNPDVLLGGGLNSFNVGHDVGGFGREGNITADYYTEQNSSDDGSGGSDGGSDGNSGGPPSVSSWAVPGTGPGETAASGFGTTTVETANGYLEFPNGVPLPVDPLYSLNSNGYSSWHQTHFSGPGGLN
jgi:hypothetical protein